MTPQINATTFERAARFIRIHNPDCSSAFTCLALEDAQANEKEMDLWSLMHADRRRNPELLEWFGNQYIPANQRLRKALLMECALAIRIFNGEEVG